ncbi:MAG: nidogen-like domain-containing protein [Sandaracinus sp.]
MRRALWLVALVAGVAGSPRSAAAQADLVTGLGGPLDFGAGVLARGDDTSSPMAIDLSPTFPSGIDFYGGHYTSVFLNMNGSITFGRALGAFTPASFPLPASSAPMIAAWWGDVDTRGVPAEPDTNLVYYGGDASHFVFTWIDVGYFDSHLDLRNAFQIVLTPVVGGGPGAFLAELRYHRCEWTTGDAPSSGGHMGLGGIAAQAGFDAADGMHFVMLPGSRTADVLALCTTSNVGDPGVWDLASEVAEPVCGNGLRETGEACDDGNLEPHDGCDESCREDTPCYTLLEDGGALVPFDGSFETGLPDGGVALAACPFDAGPPDAGPMDAGPPDAGVDGGRRGDAGTRFDAGPMRDGGLRDAGPVSHPTIDVVGGGCGCRAGRRRGGTLALGLALGLGALVRARQRWRGCVQTSGGR